ncbi:Mmset type ii, partial [Giardia duodenalis]
VTSEGQGPYSEHALGRTAFTEGDAALICAPSPYHPPRSPALV